MLYSKCSNICTFLSNHNFTNTTTRVTLLTSGSAINGSHSVASNETTVTYFSKSVSHKIVSLCTIVSTIQWADHCKHFFYLVPSGLGKRQN